jgi:hypothetical protein
MKFEIYDNFLDYQQFFLLKSSILNANFPWYLNDGIITPTETKFADESERYQFTHTFFAENNVKSSWYQFLSPVLDKIPHKNLIRIKANLLPRTDFAELQPFHCDNSFDHNVSIFYINSNNGFTVFENGDKVESVENRLLTFSGNCLHSGTTCSDKNARILINFNYV